MSIKPSESEAGSEWLIVGLGSYLGSDDAVGLALVEALSQDAAFAACCLLLESADAATVAASLIEWRRSVILVDAADMDLAPGEHRFFCDSDVSLILKSSSVSTHGFGLAEGLELARTLGYDQSVRILGIQPFDLSPRKGLTPEMTARFPYLLSALRAACTKPI